MEFRVQNVNDVFPRLVELISNKQAPLSRVESRVGPVISIDEPLTITYSRPWQRVLFNAQRDANPFFHLFESLWMLAGRNDVELLSYYNSKIGEIASDDGETLNGAYGYRWRSYQPQPIFGSWKKGDNVCPECKMGDSNKVDQLNILAKHLRENPNSRRAVLEMWNVEDDLCKIETSKDVCCNTHIYFQIQKDRLVMTVCNRSNDLLWGMLGANVVHFSFLQEYMAACIGVGIGKYHHFTNNLHVYAERKDWQPTKLLDYYNHPSVDYCGMEHFPLVEDPKRFDDECAEFVEDSTRPIKLEEPFLNYVAFPMCWAFKLYKERELKSAIKAMELVRAMDWRMAGINWLEKRKKL